MFVGFVVIDILFHETCGLLYSQIRWATLQSNPSGCSGRTQVCQRRTCAELHNSSDRDKYLTRWRCSYYHMLSFQTQKAFIEFICEGALLNSCCRVLGHEAHSVLAGIARCRTDIKANYSVGIAFTSGPMQETNRFVTASSLEPQTR